MADEQKKQPNSQIEDLQKKCEEYLNGWKRERADFLNYKKEEMERISSLAKFANEEIILKLLPILDNFYLAEAHLPEGDDFKNGFVQIKKQLEDFLKKEGVEPIKSLYEKFDANYMEVIEEVDVRKAPHDGEGWNNEESGIVVEVVQTGYMLHGKLIRPARVKITK